MQPTLKRMKTLEFSCNEGWMNFHEIFETIFAIQASQVCVVVGKPLTSDFFFWIHWTCTICHIFANTFSLVVG